MQVYDAKQFYIGGFSLLSKRLDPITTSAVNYLINIFDASVI
jgi:hypothetical protein